MPVILDEDGEEIVETGGSLGKSREQIQKQYSEMVKRHAKVARVYNSPFTVRNYTPRIQLAMMKWLERFAGYIQALRWVLHQDEELPEQYFAIPDEKDIPE